MNRMKGKKILAALGFFSIAGVAGGCSQPAPEIRYQIETDQPCQTMAYFSASDAWSMQFIGLWPQEKQNQIADWLFSTENAATDNRKVSACHSGVSMSEQVVRSKVRIAKLLLLGCVPSVS